MSLSNPKIYVAGHRGMVGSAIVRQLQAASPPHIVTRTHAELDLTNQAAVREFFAQEKPDQVYLAAAKVGGIHANNTYLAEFIYKNLMMQANVIDAAFQNGVKKLLFLGSSCIYPKLAAQPMAEEALLTGTLEPTNEPYAIAKIAGIKLCESYNRQYGASHEVDYRSVMPTKLYGPGDNYHPENSHVIPALIRAFTKPKRPKSPTSSSSLITNIFAALLNSASKKRKPTPPAWQKKPRSPDVSCSARWLNMKSCAKKLRRCNLR